MVGLGAFTGSAAAWEDNYVDFKGCSAVWMIVAKEDIKYSPPTVAHVIVETADGELVCHPEEFTSETTTTVPGQYGDAPVLKHTVEDGEKVLGVIIYNYDEYAEGEERFSRESPLIANPNRCANTPGTRDPEDALCADDYYTSGSDIVDGNQGSNGKKHSGGNEKEGGSDGKKKGKEKGSKGKKKGKEKGSKGKKKGKGRGR